MLIFFSRVRGRKKAGAVRAGLLLLVCLGFSCGGKDAAVPAPVPAASDETPAARETLRAPAVFVQGRAEFVRGGITGDLEQGAEFGAGDLIAAGGDASVELEFGGLANIRLLPGSRLRIKNFVLVRGEGAARYEVELALEGGELLAKVRKLNSGDEFFIATPNSLSGVRGTRFLLSYEPGITGRGTTLAVEEGTVALLPSGSALRDLAESRGSGGDAAALFDGVFALAPWAGAGEEISIPEGEAADLERLLEEVRSSADGLPEGTEAGRLIREALERYKSAALSGGSELLLSLMDHVRDPGAGYSALPAALPARFTGSSRENTPQTPRQREVPYPALVWEKQFESRVPVDFIGRAGRALLVMDAGGRAYGLSETGALLWESGGGALALAGFDRGAVLTEASGLAVLDAETGEGRGVYAFDGWAGLPRSRGVPVLQGIALATPRGVTICRQENAQLIREIPVAGGIISSLILAEGELVGINGQGRIVIIDAGAGAIRLEVAAELGSDVHAPCYRNGLVFGTNKAGRIVAVELQSGAIRWERHLEDGIRIEPELDAARLYVWTPAGTLIRLSSTDGSPAGSPIPNVESAPLLANGRLYFGGSGGTLISADPVSGRILKSSPIPGASSVRPLLAGNVLYAGTSDGRLLRLDASQL
jgi:outer membrane protein assembly factor BamB